jgi:hypothetical protein
MKTGSKPEYIFGHSCQVIAVAVKADESFFAPPSRAILFI